MRDRIGRLAKRVWTSPTFTTWLSLFVRAAGALLILPLVLVRLPVADVAIWQLFASLYALMLLLDFGLSPTFARLYAYARGGATVEQMSSMGARLSTSAPSQVDASSTAKTLASVFATQRWVIWRLAFAFALVLAFGGTLALQIPVSQSQLPVQAWTAWAVVVASSGLGFVGNAYGAVLQGMNSIATMRRWEALSGVAQIATSALVLFAGGGLLELTATFQFWIVFTAWRNRRLLRQLHPRLFDSGYRRDPAVVRALWPAAWRSGVGMLTSHGIIQFSGIVYSQIASAADVAAYLLALRVMTMVSQFSQAPFYSKLPDLGRLYAQGERAAVAANARLGMRRSHWVYVVGVVLAAGLCAPALALIGSHTTFVPGSVWDLMALAFFVERYGSMHLQVYTLTNHILWHIANGLTGLAMIGVALMLYPWLGLHALPAGMLVAYTVCHLPICVPRSLSVLGAPWLRFESKVALAPLLVLLGGIGLDAAFTFN